MEAEEQVRLLSAEDSHLQALKEELEKLRLGMQEDLAAATSLASSSHPTSGRSTPTILYTPAPSCNGADDTESSSPLLQTPSPQNNHHSNNYSNHSEKRRLQAHALSRSTSGTITPLTPYSPLSTTQLSEDGDEAWLSFFPPAAANNNFQMAVTPPLPPLSLPVPSAGLDAALTAAFEEGSLDLDDWENEEEWLVKTARGNKKPTYNKNQEENKENKNAAPLIVRPLPKVQVPRLNLSNDGAGTPRGGPLTFSARGGIKNNKNSAIPTSKTSGQHTARRQSQLPSRTLSNCSHAATAARMGTPRTEKINSHTSPSGSLTARRRAAVAAVASPSSAALCSNIGTGTGSVYINENSPCLFSKSMSAGAAARRDAPTPRLVLGAAELVQPNSTTTPTKKSAVEGKAFPLLRSPSGTSASTITDRGANENSGGNTRPPTRIPRLQLPLN